MNASFLVVIADVPSLQNVALLTRMNWSQGLHQLTQRRALSGFTPALIFKDDYVAQLTFFYDLSSPWTYLAFNNVQEVIAETQATVTWRPFLVGGVFNAVNQSVYAARSNPTDPKVIHNFTWLHEWARLANLPLDFPTEYHPVKSVLPMRMCCALEHDQEVLKAFTQAAFDAYFADGRNIDDPLVMARCCKKSSVSMAKRC